MTFKLINMVLKSLALIILCILGSSVSFASSTTPVVKSGLDSSRRIEMSCGGASIEIICGYNQNFRKSDDRICSNNILIFTPNNSYPIIPKSDDSLETGATPVAIQCLHEKKNNNSYYIMIRYLSGSYNCNKCEQVDIFKPDGTLLTGDESILSFKRRIPLSIKYNTIEIEARSRNYSDDSLFEKGE